MLVAVSLRALPQASIGIEDLRAPKWHATTILNTGTGVVQHTGDESFDSGTIGFLQARLAGVLASEPTAVVRLKTSDIRLYLPDVTADENAIRAVQSSVRKGAFLAEPMARLLSAFSKNKSASAVFCLSINDQDYLGSDARLFRMGAESELKSSIEAAVTVLAQNIASKTTTTSPACEPGWEGGQPPRE